jgi:type IV pilus assembly protein PilO
MPRLSVLEWLETAPPLHRLLFGVVALAVFGGVAYFIAVFPVHGRVTGLRAQHAAQQQETTRLRGLAAELGRVRREAAEVAARLDVAKDKLPSEREIPSLYRTLSDAAVQAGLAVALFQPQAPRVRDFYSEIPISVVAEGGYHDVGDFVGRLASLPRATMIGEFRLTGIAPEPARSSAAPPGASRPGTSAARGAASTPPRRPVKTEMTLVTYVYRPVGSPPAPKPAAGATKAADLSKP